MGQIILVARSGKTPRRAVQDALEQLPEGKSVALILNQGRSVLSDDYYGYGDYGRQEDVQK
jgi:hypothetical protein